MTVYQVGIYLPTTAEAKLLHCLLEELPLNCLALEAGHPCLSGPSIRSNLSP